MTPARLQMLAERLREFSPELDEAAVARMLRAVDPDYTRDLCLRVGMAVRMLARQMADDNIYPNLGDAIDHIDVAEQADMRLTSSAASPP